MTRVQSCLFALCIFALAPAAQAQQFGGERMLNPQPLPPRWASQIRVGQDVMLNPQPLPPCCDPVIARGGAVMLNPQPLPPDPPPDISALQSPGAAAMLNPQPLPPRWRLQRRLTQR